MGRADCWPAAAHPFCGHTRLEKARLAGADQLSSWESHPAGHSRDMLHMEPHMTILLKKKKKEKHNKIHSSPFLTLFDIGESHERPLKCQKFRNIQKATNVLSNTVHSVLALRNSVLVDEGPQGSFTN